MSPKSESKTIYNCHAHCFTIFHVPEYFAKRLVIFYRLFTISWIIKCGVIRKVVKLLHCKWLRLIVPEHSIMRLVLFAEFLDDSIDTQEKTIQYLQSFYPRDTRFVLLTMDMEYMAAGAPAKKFREQLNELAALKRQDTYKDLIFPFVFADPRRPNITELVISTLENDSFSGIKIYPALGYFPFDIRLKEIYVYARDHNIPIITHCIKGVVYYRGDKASAFNGSSKHPVTKADLFGTHPKDFTLNFTHPLNYECLLNHSILKTLWGDDAPDLSTLKICLGHYGGDEEWEKYLIDPWLPNSYVNGTFNPLEISHAWFNVPVPGKLQTRAYSWFSVCNELIKKYPNVYADISYSLKKEGIYPMLKMILTMPYYKDVQDFVLFGTDYFVVTKEGSDREMSIKLRAYLGEDLYFKIAHDNPLKFLA